MDNHCYYCRFQTACLQECIDHLAEEHGGFILKLRTRSLNPDTGKIDLLTKDFGIIPNDVITVDQFLQVDTSGKNWTVFISEKLPSFEKLDLLNESMHNLSLDINENDDLLKSPFAKRPKSSTPLKIVTESLSEDFSNMSFEETNQNSNEQTEDFENTDMYLKEMREMMPNVIKEMERNGYMQTWFEFHKMINSGNFPFENIAFNLFMDVAKFYTCDNTSSMKYSDTVKRFWRVGYRLFHGKWLRFMSGPKHLGKVVSEECDKGIYDPSEGSINFAVPNKSVISGKHSHVDAANIKPGIIHQLLDKVSESSTPTKTYKLCLDGKKINASTSGKGGDIDLWGYEHSPTLNEKRELLQQQKDCINTASQFIQGVSERMNMNINELLKEDKELLKVNLINIVTDLTTRIKSLREMNIQKENFKESLMNRAGEDWRKSNLVFVISGLITTIYDIKSCINNLMKVIDQACQVIASLNGKKYTTANVVNMIELEGYMHFATGGDDPRFVKQRSERWFEIRETAKVTGSTINDAIGLRTLKKQTEHFDKVISQISKPEPPESVKTMMAYGVENERHAVATLAAKVLPVLNSDLQLFEEGCYPISVNGVACVVSPDGSCRLDTQASASYAIEIKCPFPGKKFATPVFYNVPTYYVPQILSEMKVLQTERLYFVCFSEESTTVQEVEFDHNLWNMIENEICLVYGAERPSRPSRKSENVPRIQEKIRTFVNENVRLIMEIPSVKGVDCNAQNDTEDAIYCSKHVKSDLGEGDLTIDFVQELLYNADVNIDRAYQLTRNKASEFLGFMLSDLDRNYHPEKMHSVPVAYGLKGYSLPTNTLRIMVEDVLKECSKRGMYVPVCSFDGQWCRLVVRDRDQKPLTVFQLQKDVFEEARKRPKNELIRKMSESNTIEASSFEELKGIVHVDWKSRVKEPEKHEKYLDIGAKKTGFTYTISKHIFEMIRGNESCNTEQTEQPKEVRVEDDLLNSVPDDVLDSLSIDVVEQVHTLAYTGDNHPNQTSQVRTTETAVNENRESQSLEMDIEETVQVSERAGPENQLRHLFLNDTDYQAMLSCLQNDQRSSMKNRWNTTLYKFKELFTSAESIKKSFFVYELQLILRNIIGNLKANGIKLNLSSNKTMIVNALSKALGDGSVVGTTSRRKANVPKLKSLAKSALKKIKKDYLNIIEAENTFPQRLAVWYSDSPFGKYIRICTIDCNDQPSWYSRPELNENVGYYLFMILDAYHQLCGARRLFCLKGMPAANIYNSYIHKVAEESESNGSGLNTAMVKEPMLDRQSVAYAVATFSEKVEQALINIGAGNEANFCRLIRNWYRAEDEPGISAEDRCEYRLELRKWLLRNVNFGKFPPSGAYVKDIPIVLYEGLITGIERRLQLFPFTKSGAYNVRAIGSLDIENFFGGFQDVDPWGTGVLRPDSISTALGVAIELTEARMKPDRGFHMLTSSSKVYPCNTYEGVAMETDDSQMSGDTIRDVSIIQIKDHAFDASERKRGKRKRKLGNVSRPDEPVRRPTTVREFHRAHESKILPHVRRGLNLKD